MHWNMMRILLKTLYNMRCNKTVRKTNLLISADNCGWFALGRTITGCWCLNPWSAIICNPCGKTGSWMLLQWEKNIHVSHGLFICAYDNYSDTYLMHAESLVLPTKPGLLYTTYPSESTITNQFKKWQCLS